MINMDNYFFPAQKVTSKERDEDWFHKCVQAAEKLIYLHNEGEVELKRKMQVWYDLDKDIIDENEIERVFNPMQLKDVTFPAAIKNYPLTTPKIDLLQGEEIKRKYDWAIISQNEDAHSVYTQKLRDELITLAVKHAQGEIEDPKEVEKRTSEIIKYYSYEYKELHELTANRILKYLWREQDMQEKFTKGFRDALISSREIYRVDDFGGEPTVLKCDPRNIFALRRGGSQKIEDADIIVEIEYAPIGQLIDEFHSDLTPDQIDDLESGYRTMGSGQTNGILNHINRPPILYTNAGFAPTDVTRPIEEMQPLYTYGMPYDIKGNARVVRVRWLGRRKLGKLTYFDENGDEQVKLVSEFYKANKTLGETVTWFWVNEALEGTKLGHDIFVRTRVRPLQMRHFDNPSKCFLGYVGTDYTESMMKRMEPFQYLYNIYMRRLDLAIARYHGPIYELDLAKKPDDWDVEQWMYYAEVLGYMVVDSFNEGQKGASMGKLAGGVGNTSGKVLNADIGNYIQQIVMMLGYIESQLGKIAGVTEQRQGQISNRETVGGIERAVQQSSNVTEKWFFIHDQTKRRVLQALLDTAKQIWSTKNSIKLNYIMDDMSRQFISFNGSEFASGEYDIFSSSSTENQEIRELIKSLSHAAVQNGASMSLPIQILKSDSIADMTRKLERDETDRQQREAESQDKQMKSQEQMNQAIIADKEKDRELKYYEIDKKFEAATMNIQEPTEELPEDNTLELQKLDLDRNKVSQDSDIKRAQLAETKRHNLEQEKISKMKPKVSSK